MSPPWLWMLIVGSLPGLSRTPTVGVALAQIKYVTTEHTVVIERRGESLWLLLDGFPIPKYLAPVAPHEFELRSDIGRIVFDTTGGGPSPQLTWVFGPGAQTVYPRRERR